MACCCKELPGQSTKAASSCLGRCDLAKHRCLDREEIKPGPVPKHMGWLYTARDAPEHQLRCGWRPGHISCPVLRKIDQHNCMKGGECGACASRCNRPPCLKPCCLPPRCPPVCTPTPSCGKMPKCLPVCGPTPSCGKVPRCLPVCGPTPPCGRVPKCLPVCGPTPPCGRVPLCASPCGTPCPPPCDQPLIRIIRHAGQYSICTKPSNITNAPSGPYPLKYVLNPSSDGEDPKDVKFSVEAKFNDYHFDYTSSQSSFVLDFSPPEPKCNKPCGKPCPQPC